MMTRFSDKRKISHLQQELGPMSQVVGENSGVEGFYAFFIEPALTEGTILVQLLKIWPPGHLNRDTGGDRGRNGATLTEFFDRR